jgi:hypothetical protein
MGYVDSHFPGRRFAGAGITMLQRILQILRESEGVISVRALAQQLGAEPSAVEGMLQQLVRMGKLTDGSGQAQGESCSTCRGCSGTDECPLLFFVPKRYRVVEE